MSVDPRLTVSVATPDDVEQVLDLVEELFDPPGGRPTNYGRNEARRRTDHCVLNPNADILLAVDAGKPVGLATVYVDVLSIRQGRRCWVEEMIVASHARSRGVGRLLLERAREWARNRGCSHIQLHSGLGRKDAHRFYLSNGMNQVAYVFSQDLELAI